MSQPIYIIGDIVTAAFFAGVAFVLAIITLIAGLDLRFESGVLIPVSIVLFTASFILFRIAIATGRGLYR